MVILACRFSNIIVTFNVFHLFTRTRWRLVKTLGQHQAGVNFQSHAQHQLWISAWPIFHEFYKIMPGYSYAVSYMVHLQYHPGWYHFRAILQVWCIYWTNWLSYRVNKDCGNRQTDGQTQVTTITFGRRGRWLKTISYFSSRFVNPLHIWCPLHFNYHVQHSKPFPIYRPASPVMS